MAQYNFGVGRIWGIIPGTATFTPAPIGTLQEASLDISFTTKKLYGQYQFPEAIGRGEASATLKCKTGRFSANAFNALFAGQTVSTTALATTNAGESATVPTTPFTVTVSNATTFVDDLGVAYGATGIYLTRVAASPATGQYAVNTATGVYTFAAGDTGVVMTIWYSYNTAAAAGYNSVVTNQLMGNSPNVALVLSNIFNGNILTLKFYQALSAKLTANFKNTDFTVPELDFEIFADSQNRIYQWSQSVF